MGLIYLGWDPFFDGVSHGLSPVDLTNWSRFIVVAEETLWIKWKSAVFGGQISICVRN